MQNKLFIKKFNNKLGYKTIFYKEKSNEYGHYKNNVIYLNESNKDMSTSNLKLIIKSKSAINTRLLLLKKIAMQSFSNEELLYQEKKYIKKYKIISGQSILNGYYTNEILLDAILERNNFSMVVKKSCKDFRSFVLKTIKEHIKKNIKSVKSNTKNISNFEK